MPDLISLALLIAGFPLGATKLRRLSKPLSTFLVYVVAPILGFWAGLSARTSWLAALAALPELLVFAIARLGENSCPLKGAVSITSAFGNTIFLGIPAVVMFSGNVDIALMYAMTTTLFHYTLAATFSCKKGWVRLQPFTFTFILGIILSPFSKVIYDYGWWSKSFAVTASKLGLLLLGLNFKKEHLAVDKKIGKIGLYKHLVLPLLTFPIAVLGGHVKTLLIESSMPPAFMNIALAIVYGYDVDLVTKSVITLTVLWLVPFGALYLFQLLT